jgi:hypothetical protein
MQTIYIVALISNLMTLLFYVLLPQLDYNFFKVQYIDYLLIPLTVKTDCRT